VTLVPITALHPPILTVLHGESFAKGWDEDAFDKLLALPGMVGWIWEDTQPRGFILVRSAADEAEIVTIAVTPTQRGRGIAAALLDAATAHLQAIGVRDFFLEVATDNAAARRLYDNAAFEVCGGRKKYYEENGVRKDAVIMKRTLQKTSSDGR